MNILKKIWQHILYCRETYGWVPIAFGLVFLTLHFVNYVTGRPVVDDPGSLAGFAYNFAGVILVLVAVALAKPHLFDDIDTTELMKKAVELSKDHPFGAWIIVCAFLRVLLDSIETFVLLALAAGLCFSLWQ